MCIFLKPTHQSGQFRERRLVFKQPETLESAEQDPESTPSVPDRKIELTVDDMTKILKDPAIEAAVEKKVDAENKNSEQPVTKPVKRYDYKEDKDALEMRPEVIAGYEARNELRKTLEAKTKTTAEASQMLLDALQSPHELVRIFAREELQESKPVPIEQIKTLFDQYHAKKENIPVELSEMMLASFPRDVRVIPAISARLGDKDRDVAFAAKEALGGLGSRALPLLRELQKSADPRKREGVVEVLEQLGKMALPAPLGDPKAPKPLALTPEHLQERIALLKQAASDPDADVRIKLIRTLRDSFRLKDSAPELLRSMLDDPKDLVRYEAALALSSIAPDQTRAVRGLLKEALVQDTFKRRDMVPAALLQTGDKTDAAFLLEHFADADLTDPIRYALQKAPDAPQYIAQIMPFLRHEKEEVRFHAAMFISKMNPKEAAAVQPLIAALKKVEEHGEPLLKAFVAMEKVAAGPLIDTLNDLQADPDVRHGAAMVLLNMPEQSKRSLPSLKKALSDANADVRIAAAFAVTEFDGDDTKAWIVLSEGLDHVEAEARHAAAYQFKRLKKIPAEVVPRLKAMMIDHREPTHIRAQFVFGPLWRGDVSAAKEALEIIMKNEKEDAKFREEAKEQLEKLKQK